MFSFLQKIANFHTKYTASTNCLKIRLKKKTHKIKLKCPNSVQRLKAIFQIKLDEIKITGEFLCNEGYFVLSDPLILLQIVIYLKYGYSIRFVDLKCISFVIFSLLNSVYYYLFSFSYTQQVFNPSVLFLNIMCISR